MYRVCLFAVTNVSKLDRYISNYKEAYHPCGPNNLINPINAYASISLISSISLLCYMKKEPSYTCRGD